MLRSIAIVMAFGLMVGEGAAQADPVRVVATLPVYADLVEKIGGAEVDVSAIAAPNEDPGTPGCSDCGRARETVGTTTFTVTP